jgi:hypothetical protein
MQVGDLVQIGWNGKTKEPFIGTVVEVPTLSECCYILCNGKRLFRRIKDLRRWKT